MYNPFSKDILLTNKLKIPNPITSNYKNPTFPRSNRSSSSPKNLTFTQKIQSMEFDWFRSPMAFDLLIQAVLLSSIALMFLWMLNIPQKLFHELRYRDRSSYAAKRHFVLGAEFLARSRSIRDRTTAGKLAKSAEEEADKSIAVNPKDAAAHILKAIALDFQGFTTSALDAINVALSPLAVKSLSDEEKGDALFKRAEMKVKASKGEGVETAVDDLVESVRLKPDNAAALRFLGECYEKKEMMEEAVKAYSDAVKLEPESKSAQDALARLAST